MATYVIGDIQGCFNTFESLLMRINFKADQDRLFLLGDVINRGPRSLEVLRFIMHHEKNISMVLGNHEIFALALMLGVIETKSPKTHTLYEILRAPDLSKIINYLQSRPLLIIQDKNIFVHAGLFPGWNIKEAQAWALVIQERLAGAQAQAFLSEYFSSLEIKQDIYMALASFTRMRMCVSKNILDLSYTGGLADAPAGLKPWFMLRDDGKAKIFFGHWAALGLYNYKNYYCLDSGCSWGRNLSALCLEDHTLFQVDNCD